jgi:hypothetical protein
MRASASTRSRAATATWSMVLAAFVLVPIMLSSSTAQAAGLQLDKDTFIDVHMLLQPTAQFRYDDSKDNPNAQHAFGDFYMRRTRFVMAGQVTKWVTFFAETDMPNWGKAGDWGSPTFYVQDAYMQFNIHEAFNIVGGMILTPFVHNASQGATSLHNLDYHSDLVRYPASLVKNAAPISNKVWRDNGVMFRGFLLNKHLDYRIAFTNGVQDGAVIKDATATAPQVNAATGECPRFSGRIQYNFFDAEEGFFLAGTYLGKKKLLSVGFAYDVQPGVYGAHDNMHQYWGFGGDIFLDMPINKRDRLSGQFDFVGYGGDTNPTRGKGFLFDLGYAMGKWEPLIAIDYYRGGAPLLDAENNEITGFKKDLLGLHVGLNYWLKGHAANVKLDLGQIKSPGFDFEHSATVITLQTQLYL